ncbi:hypothetical protein LJR220_003352 [Bradyrhizobium sp. LjRoot220]|uniref:hypothetical protein n=1 Tax=Bradyrhizobium sp. LjRoot220 TaxID=3342284 RepID=UPI003ECFB51A
MARKKEPKKTGRPPVTIDPVDLEKLGALHATLEEVAGFYGCTKRTVINRLKDPDLLLAFENGKQKGKLNLRRLQMRHAQGTGSGAVNMTIHLSKHLLGQTDKSLLELTGKNGGAIETRDVSARAVVAGRIASIASRIRTGGDSGGPDGSTA